MSPAGSKAPPPTPFATVLDQAQGPLAFVPRAADDGGVVWEYQVDPQHFNPYGALHGGVVLALLDTAMGHAVATKVHAAGRFNVAAQMNTNFLAPVYLGTLRARGIFPNPGGVMTPGLFARLRVPGSEPYRTLLVPELSVQTDQNSKYVLTVDAQNTVQARTRPTSSVVSGLGGGPWGPRWAPPPPPPGGVPPSCGGCSPSAMLCG